MADCRFSFGATSEPSQLCSHMAMGQKPAPPVNIPIPTKIDSNWWCTYPKMVPSVLTHSHILERLNARCFAALVLRALQLKDGRVRHLTPAEDVPPALLGLWRGSRLCHAGACLWYDLLMYSATQKGIPVC